MQKGISNGSKISESKYKYFRGAIFTHQVILMKSRRLILSKQKSRFSHFNPLSTTITKWSNTLKQFVGKLPTNCLSVFVHFVGLALKWLTIILDYDFCFTETFCIRIIIIIVTKNVLCKYFWYCNYVISN